MNKKGFTLIEMLLVIALIATITAVVIPNIVSSVNEGKTKEYESYVKLLEDNLEMYKTDLNIKLGENENYKTVDLDTLKSRVSEIKIDEDKCKIQKDSNNNEYLRIQKETNGVSYCVKLTCDGKEYKSNACK